MPAARALDDRVDLAVQATREAVAIDDVVREGAHLFARPPGEAPRHDFAHALLGKGPLEVRRVNPARDFHAIAGIREGVVASRPPQGLQGRGFHAPVAQERMKEVIANVAAPEGAVTVRRNDASRSIAAKCLDPCPDLVGGLLLHVASISDRSRLGLV